MSENKAQPNTKKEIEERLPEPYPLSQSPRQNEASSLFGFWFGLKSAYKCVAKERKSTTLLALLLEHTHTEKEREKKERKEKRKKNSLARHGPCTHVSEKEEEEEGFRYISFI